ncbi:MAG: rhomboid family intramembrane serine protease [Flavobacteriales bacterium]
MTPYITYVIMAITALVSYKAFQDSSLKWRFMFNAYEIKRKKEWYRFFSHGLIHADWVHLGLNIYVLYLFGGKVEHEFIKEFGMVRGIVNYLLLYIGGLAVSSFYSYAKHQDNPNYNSLGASGAVSAVVFASIALFPMDKLGIILIPFYIPGVIFGALYLLYSNYMAKKQMDNIGHDAHFWGALFGFVITFVFNPSLLSSFVNQITNAL